MHIPERYGSNPTDIHRIASDIQTEIDSDGSEINFLRRVAREQSHTEAYERIISPVTRFAHAAFNAQLGKFISNHSSQNISIHTNSIHPIYIGSPFRHGITYGLDLNRRILGNDLDPVVAPHIDYAVDIPGLDYSEYAHELEVAGRYVYNSQLSGANTTKSPDPLWVLSNKIAYEAYDGTMAQTSQFKAGVGLARQALFFYVGDMNKNFAAIINKSA